MPPYLIKTADEESSLAAKRGSFSFRVGYREAGREAATVRRRGLGQRVNATLPLYGSVQETGYFYANIYLGTPAREFAVITDTGSAMTYVHCAACGDSCGPNHFNQPFDPAASSSAELVPCGRSECLCSSQCGCDSSSQCTFSVSYAESSSSKGTVVSDLLAVLPQGPAARVSFGCETAETGMIYSQQADGLLALGNSQASLVTQLVADGAIDDVFSLCFGGVEGDGALVLGSAPLPPDLGQLQYTPLLRDGSYSLYYRVELEGIALGGQQLQVDQAVYSQGYGAMLDSGTTYIYLPSDAFQAFTAEVERQAVQNGLYKVDPPSSEYKDICYGGGPADYQDAEGLSQAFPTMSLDFAQMEPLVLPPLNYLFVPVLGSGKYCLGVFENPDSGTILGGIAFRNILVQYDRENWQAGFGPTDCRELGSNSSSAAAAAAFAAGPLPSNPSMASGPAPSSPYVSIPFPGSPNITGLPPPSSSPSSNFSRSPPPPPSTGGNSAPKPSPAGDQLPPMLRGILGRRRRRHV
ncbi:hypothetical protein N2152v2_001058 [Parachlorella kessleri]